MPVPRMTLDDSQITKVVDDQRLRTLTRRRRRIKNWMPPLRKKKLRVVLLNREATTIAEEEAAIALEARIKPRTTMGEVDVAAAVVVIEVAVTAAKVKHKELPSKTVLDLIPQWETTREIRVQLSRTTNLIVNKIVDEVDEMVVAVAEKVAVVVAIAVAKAVVVAVVTVVEKAVVVAIAAVKAAVVVTVEIAVVKAVAEVTVEVAVVEVLKVMVETNSREAVVVEVAVDAVEILPLKRVHMHPLIAPTSEKSRMQN